jgi:hypothetical protein
LIEAVHCPKMSVHSTRQVVKRPWKDNRLMS